MFTEQPTLFQAMKRTRQSSHPHISYRLSGKIPPVSVSLQMAVNSGKGEQQDVLRKITRVALSYIWGAGIAKTDLYYSVNDY